MWGSAQAPCCVAAGVVRDKHCAGADSAMDDAIAVRLLQAISHIQDHCAGVL